MDRQISTINSRSVGNSSITLGIRVFVATAVVLAVALPAGGETVTTQPAVITPSADQVDQTDQTDVEEELLLFEEMPVVISASRQSQPINWLSASVGVITDEDIHYSGVTSVPEMLMFTPGVDVAQIDRNRWAIGVHGLFELASDRTLVLIDGRSVSCPMGVSIPWAHFPVFMEDIARIEVVRGPAGAVWGANAYTGVINVITKNPEDSLGWFGSTTWNQFGDSYSHLRWAAKEGKWSWRTSVGYEDRETSEDAIDNDHFASRDFSRDWRFDGKAIYRSSDRTKTSFGLTYSNAETGDNEWALFWPQKNGRYEMAKAFLRVDHEFQNGSSGYLQWFGNYFRIAEPSIATQMCSTENDLEAQYNFTVAEKHEISLGGNLRWTHLWATSHDPQEWILHGEPLDEYVIGLFIMDRWQITDRLVLEGQVRGDWYSGTHTDWSTRVSALYALDEQKHHVLRISGAKSFRTLLPAYRDASVRRVPVAPGLYGINHLASGNLDNEQTWSVEAGYTGRLAKGLSLRVNSYYQRFDDMVGLAAMPEPFPPIGRMFSQFDNVNGADTFGVETELAFENKVGKITGWYSYNAANLDYASKDIRAALPARHKIGATGRLFLPQGWTANANYRYSTEAAAASMATAGGQLTPDYRNFGRLDLAIAKKVANGHGEILFGVSDVLDETNVPNFSIGATAHETPGRTFFARFQIKF